MGGPRWAKPVASIQNLLESCFVASTRNLLQIAGRLTKNKVVVGPGALRSTIQSLRPVYLHKPRSLLFPLTESAQRNLLLQQGSRLSAATPAQLMLATLGTQQPVDRRRADAQQFCSHFWLNLSSPKYSSRRITSGIIATRRLPQM